MVQIPKQIDLLSLMVNTGEQQAFFIDAKDDLLIVEPHDPQSWSHRFIAWLCGWSHGLKQHALQNGWLPVDIAPAHLITGLHEALQLIRPVSKEDLTLSIRNRLAVRGACSVMVARSLAGLVANPTPARREIAKCVAHWTALDSVRRRGVDAAASFKIRNFALLLAESDDFRDQLLTPEWVRTVVDRAARVFFLSHNGKALGALLEALRVVPGTDPTTEVEMRKSIRSEVQRDKQMRMAILDKTGELETMIEEAFETVRARMLGSHLGITPDLAQRIISRARELTPESTAWPQLCDLPSESEAKALLDLLRETATADAFFASTCTHAAAELGKTLAPRGKGMEPEALEVATVRKNLALEAAVKAFGRRLSQEERQKLQTCMDTGQSPSEVFKALVAFRRSATARLSEYLLGERRIALAGASSPAQAALTGRLHAQGLLPSHAVAEFLQAAQTLRRVLKQCGEPCASEKKGVPVLHALRDAHAVLQQLQALQSKKGPMSDAEVQALAQVAARDLIDSARKSHEGRAWTLDSVIHAFGGKQVLLLMAGLRSSELAGQAESQSMQRLLTALADALHTELAASPADSDRAGRMKPRAQALPSVKGVSLQGLRPGIALALREHFRRPAAATLARA